MVVGELGQLLSKAGSRGGILLNFKTVILDGCMVSICVSKPPGHCINLLQLCMSVSEAAASRFEDTHCTA
jgi:hypothetical protein